LVVLGTLAFGILVWWWAAREVGLQNRLLLLRVFRRGGGDVGGLDNGVQETRVEIRGIHLGWVRVAVGHLFDTGMARHDWC